MILYNQRITKEVQKIMELYNYENLIRVIGNVEKREENEKLQGLFSLKEKYFELEKNLIQSGILEDWVRLKELCRKAQVRLCVSHISSGSIGCVLGVGDFKYANIYDDNGRIKKLMSSGSHWSDYYGFYYDTKAHCLIWEFRHTTDYHSFEYFKTEEEKYNTKIYLLEEFKNTYENYRKFQLMKIEEKFGSRITVEDIID